MGQLTTPPYLPPHLPTPSIATSETATTRASPPCGRDEPQQSTIWSTSVQAAGRDGQPSIAQVDLLLQFVWSVLPFVLPSHLRCWERARRRGTTRWREGEGNRGRTARHRAAATDGNCEGSEKREEADTAAAQSGGRDRSAASGSFLLRRCEGALVDVATAVERDERRAAAAAPVSHRSILFYGNIIGLHFLWIGSQCSSIIWR